MRERNDAPGQVSKGRSAAGRARRNGPRPVPSSPMQPPQEPQKRAAASTRLPPPSLRRTLLT
jgi:hypothetical protein